GGAWGHHAGEPGRGSARRSIRRFRAHGRLSSGRAPLVSADDWRGPATPGPRLWLGAAAARLNAVRQRSRARLPRVVESCQRSVIRATRLRRTCHDSSRIVAADHPDAPSCALNAPAAPTPCASELGTSYTLM